MLDEEGRIHLLRWLRNKEAGVMERGVLEFRRIYGADPRSPPTVRRSPKPPLDLSDGHGFRLGIAFFAGLVVILKTRIRIE
jgi:hypothetical protein